MVVNRRRGGMQRRGGSGQPVKGQSANRPKARNAPTAQVSTADLQEQLDRRARELEEALQQQTAANEVLSIIRRSPADAQPVFDAIVQSAARLCDAIFSVVYLCDGENLRIAATKNFTPEATGQLHQLQQLKRPDRSHLGGRAILDRAIIHVHDVLADPEYSHEFALAGGWRAVLAVPLLRDGIAVGAISVGKAEPTPFSDRQIQLLNTFADQALIAIDNVRLFEAEQQRTRELSESLEQQTATSEVLKVISSSPGELNPVFNAMLENAIRICDASYGAMWLRDGNEFRNAAFHGALSPAYTEQWQRGMAFDPSPHGPLTRISKSRKPLQVADMREDRAYREGHPLAVASVDVAGIRTLVAVPMLKDDELMGAIAIYRKEVRLFTDKQIELVKNFAAQAVIAIENTRLLNELRESLQQQTATADVLKVISSSRGELDPVFEAMLENATKLCEASYGTMYLREGDGYRAAARQGHSPNIAQQRWWTGEHFKPRSDVPLARCARTRAPVHVVDTRQEPAYLAGDSWMMAGVDDAGIRSMVVVPMLKGDELLGAISIYRTKVRPFSDKQIELVQNFASQAVIAIENTRLLNELRKSLQQQTATADVLKTISRSTFDLQTVLDTLVKSAARLCEADLAAITRQSGDKHRLIASYGYSPELKEHWAQNLIPSGRGSISGRVMLEGRAVHAPNVLADPEFQVKEAAIIGGISTMLGVPLLREGSPIRGYGASTPHPFAIHRQTDRVGHYLCRPGSNRHRKRAAVRRGAGAHTGAF